MLRITTGIVKNKKLKIPKGSDIKAVQEVVKLAAFAIITPDNVTNATCLDLFAGTGNMGLEALSRGATHCDFVDNNFFSIGAIKDNVTNCGFNEQSEIIKDDAVKFVANTHNKYNIIFADPFYEDIKHKFLIKNLHEILLPKGYIIFTHGEQLNMEDQIKDSGLKLITQRRFGKSYLSVLQHG